MSVLYKTIVVLSIICFFSSPVKTGSHLDSELGFNHCDKVYGSAHSNIYHKEDCISKRMIFEENLIIFENEIVAKERNYRACYKCF